jgi:hypothetical protein
MSDTSSTNLPNDPINGLTIQPQSSVPFWDTAPVNLDPSNNDLNIWDICVLNGNQLPGLCRLRSKTHREYDIKKSKGGNGATLTFTGYYPAEVVIENRIWTRYQLNVLTSIAPLISPKTNQNPKAVPSDLAVDIYHPALSIYSISSVIVVAIDILEQSPVRGVWQQRIHCLEYVPQVKGLNTTATIKASANLNDISSAGLGKKGGPTPPSQNNVGPNRPFIFP